MTSEKKIELFEKMSVPVAVCRLALPTVMSSLVLCAYMLTDTYFVGMLNDPIQNAAVALATPLMVAFYAVVNLFGIGTSSLMSRSLGRHEYEKVKHISSFGFLSAMAVCVCIAAGISLFKTPILGLLGAEADTVDCTADYILWAVQLGITPAVAMLILEYLLQAEGESLHAGLGIVSGSLLNIVLDPVFILPQYLDMGAGGAGMATCISDIVSCLYFFIFLYRKRRTTFISLSPKHFSFSRETVFGIVGVGVPATLQNLFNVSGMLLLNNLAAPYGADAVAAMGIAVHRVGIIPFFVAFGMAQGVSPLIGYCYGAKNFARMRSTMRFTLTASLSALAGVSVLMFLYASETVTFFIEYPAIVGKGAVFLQIVALSVPLLAIDFFAVNVFQACGKGRYAFIFALVRKIILEIPLLFLLNRLWPLYGLACAQLCAEAVMACMALYFLGKIIRSAAEA